MKILPQLQLLCCLALSLLLSGCENKEAPDQLTAVEGQVLRNSDKVPLAGVLLVAEPYTPSFGFLSFSAPVDSIRTDVNGHYSLHFYNKKGFYYAISCDPNYTNRKLDFLPFPENSPHVQLVGGNIRRRPIAIGKKNEVSFYPAQSMVILLRLQLRSTRFQQLVIGAGWKLRANSLDTVIRRGGHWGAGTFESATMRRVGAGGQTLQDSTVYLYSLSNIATDTIRTTFRFIR